MSIRFTERLAEAGIHPSVGAVGSSYDNALAIEDVELATARWIDWINHRRLYEYCGDVSPVEFEAAYYPERRRPAAGWDPVPKSLRTSRGGSCCHVQRVGASHTLPGQ
jgi:putative transposase